VGERLRLGTSEGYTKHLATLSSRSEVTRRSPQLVIRKLVADLEHAGGATQLQPPPPEEEEQIDETEIFCCKCERAESCNHNDILLCDGACNRAFHQQCLDPPLATEDSACPLASSLIVFELPGGDRVGC
jgi:hypothetical protein